MPLPQQQFQCLNTIAQTNNRTALYGMTPAAAAAATAADPSTFRVTKTTTKTAANPRALADNLICGGSTVPSNI